MEVIKKIREVSTRGMSNEKWLALRKTTIGGSEAAAIIGLDPYCTAYTLWHKKRSDTIDEPSLPAQFGQFAEEFVAQLFEKETGKKVRRRNAIIYNSDYPFAHANIDRRINGENAGLECKTTSALNLKKFRGGEFPAKYYVQCMHYMMVCGFERMYLACLIGNSQFKVFTIERDEAEIQSLAAAEEEFFALMNGDTPPEITAAECDSETLLQAYAEPNEDELMLMEGDSVFERLAELEERKIALEAEITLAKNRIKNALGNAQRGYTDNYRCSWTAYERSTVDTKKLFAEHPEIDKEAYTKTTQTRTFRFSKINKEDE